MADASGGDKGTLRTIGRAGNGDPPVMHFSVEGSNRASLRSAGGGGSGAPRTMDECEGIKKLIIMEDKGIGGNGTLRTAGGYGNGLPPVMQFSVKGSNRAPPRSAGGGGSGALRTMDKCEGGNEGGNGATPPKRAPIINTYVKQSILGGVRKGGGDRVHGGARKGENSSGHGGKRKGSGAKLNSKKNCPRKTGRGSLMHAFGISGIVEDVGREEGKERINYLYGKAQAGEGGCDDRPSSKELPSWRREYWLQMLVGKDLNEEGRAYNRVNNMKLWT